MKIMKRIKKYADIDIVTATKKFPIKNLLEKLYIWSQSGNLTVTTGNEPKSKLPTQKLSQYIGTVVKGFQNKIPANKVNLLIFLNIKTTSKPKRILKPGVGSMLTNEPTAKPKANACGDVLSLTTSWK
ncbi:MAG: hypothetical protein ABIC04_05085 [Nanoarchaeota archaeon]